jgi:hypothetical protein
MARSLDRSLVEEVAMTEMSLARHVLYLRRLMLRYVKTLLMFLWTAIISFMMLPLLKDPRFPALLILALGYLIWSLSVMRVMNWPIYWIYRHLHDDSAADHVDPQLMLMQMTLKRYCYTAIAASVAAVILSAAALIVK